MPNSTLSVEGSVADVSETELIARIKDRLPPAPEWLLVGIGDDAAVIETERNRLEVLSVDALVEGVHFDRAFTPPDAIGYRALAVNLSDLAAMGATPRAALLSFVLPSHLPIADFDLIVGGFVRLASEERVNLIGGNITRTAGPMVLDVTVVGTVKPRRALTRGGARPGDELYVSGTIGSAGAGLDMLRAAATQSSASSASFAGPMVEGCVDRYLYPQPRLRLGTLLARNRIATACVDLSDGLADGVRRIAAGSSVGVTLDGDAIPIESGARHWFDSQGSAPMVSALTSGDDYELLFAVRPRGAARRLAAARGSGTAITRIGVCTRELELRLSSTTSGTRTEQELPQPGFRHFR